MSSLYPASIDTHINLPTVTDNITRLSGSNINILRDTIIFIESELGVKPSGTYTTVRARLDAMEAAIDSIIGGGGGGPSVIFGGDLAGNNLHQEVVGIHGIALSGIIPTAGQVLEFNGSVWTPHTITPDDIQSSYEVTLLGPTMVEIGQIIFNPLFSASYSQTPTTATFADNVGGPTENVLTAPSPSTKNLFFYNQPTPQQYRFNTYGSSVIFTLTSSNGLSTAVATNTLTWVQNIYFGAAVPSGYTSSFVRSLLGSFLGTSRQTTFTAFAGAGQNIFYAYRSAYGPADFWVYGWEGGFTLVATVAVTNSSGFTENYNLYQSNQTNLGSTTVNVF